MVTRMANRVFGGLLLLLLLALISWGGVWFMQNFERQSEEIRSGFSSEARRNPLLAAERFLRRLGLQTESLAGREYLRSPPAVQGRPSAAGAGSTGAAAVQGRDYSVQSSAFPPSMGVRRTSAAGAGSTGAADEPGVLLVKDLGPSLAPERERRLLAWVANGGHLIATPGRVPAEDEAGNHLLETLGVSFIELDPESPPADAGPVEVMLPDTELSASVAFDPTRSFRLEQARVYWEVPAAEGYHLLRFYHGNGMITLLSDNRFFTNSRIDEHDHALFLASLMEGAGQAWLLYSSQMPTLPLLLWRNAPYLVISGCLWSVLLVWWLTYRSGPILIQANAQRRDLLEHLQAASEYLWKQEWAGSLQKRTREQVEKRWLRSHPHLQRMARPERCAWLAQRTGLSAESIREALYAEQTHERNLLETSANLQRLLLALHPEKQMEQTHG